MFMSFNGVTVDEIAQAFCEEELKQHKEVTDRIDVAYNYDYSIPRNIEYLIRNRKLPQLNDDEKKALADRLLSEMLIKDGDGKTACEKTAIISMQKVSGIYGEEQSVNIQINFDYDFESLAVKALEEIRQNNPQISQGISSYCIVIGSDDNLHAKEMTDIADTALYLGGEPKHIYDIPLPSNNPYFCPETHKVQVWCNKDFLTINTDDCKRFNALGTTLKFGNIEKMEEADKEDCLWGNIIVCGEREDGSSRGLSEFEKTQLMENFEKFLANIGEQGLNYVHNKNDGKRPEPKITMITYGKDDFKDIIENAKKKGNNLW